MSGVLSVKELFCRESEQTKLQVEPDVPIRSSRVWINPGDAFCSYSNNEISTNFLGMQLQTNALEANSNSVKRTNINLNVRFSYEIVDVYTSKTTNDKLCFVVLSNGEVHAHTFDLDIQKWVFNFVFHLMPTTNSQNNEAKLIKSVTFDDDFTSVIWCQTSNNNSAFQSSLFYRQVSLTPLTSVSNLSINTYPSVCILNFCPELKITFANGFISCLLKSSSKIGIFLTWSSDTQLSMHDTEGRTIYHIPSLNVDFSEILVETVGLWTDSGDECIFQTANKVSNVIYILTQNSNVLSLNKSEVVSAKVTLSPGIVRDNIKGFLVYGLMIILYTIEEIIVHDLLYGKLLFNISLHQYEPLINMWYFSTTTVTGFGFYGASKVFQIVPESYEELLVKCNVNGLDTCCNPDWVFLSQINALLLNKDVKQFDARRPSLQSPALSLALMHNFKMKNNSSMKRSCSIALDDLFTHDKVDTRLSKILWPLVDSFMKLEEFRNQMLSD